MANYQKLIIVGHLGRDVETRYLPNGDAVANFSVAVSESWKDKSGNKQDRSTWFRVSAFGKLAEICAQYLVKGSSVLIEGKITTNKYTDKNGVEKESWDVRADAMQMLGGNGQRTEQKDANSASKPAQNQSRSSQGAGPVNDPFDDSQDIPF